MQHYSFHNGPVLRPTRQSHIKNLGAVSDDHLEWRHFRLYRQEATFLFAGFRIKSRLARPDDKTDHTLWVQQLEAERLRIQSKHTTPSAPEDLSWLSRSEEAPAWLGSLCSALGLPLDFSQG